MISWHDLRDDHFNQIGTVLSVSWSFAETIPLKEYNGLLNDFITGNETSYFPHDILALFAGPVTSHRSSWAVSDCNTSISSSYEFLVKTDSSITPPAGQLVLTV